MIGDGYCSGCDSFLSYIPLTGYNKDCECCDGKKWQVQNEFSCSCGKDLKWLHQPSDDSLTLDLSNVFELVEAISDKKLQ